MSDRRRIVPVMDARAAMTLTPELAPRRDVVEVTLRMPRGASAEFVQSFAVSAASVLSRLDMHGVMVEATAYVLRVSVAVTGAEDREAAEAEAYRQVEAAAGGYLAVERPGA